MTAVLSAEPIIRLGVFATVFALMAAWELMAPRRQQKGLSGISCVGGHDWWKGAQPCRDAKSLIFLMPSWTSCWLGPIPRRPLIRTAKAWCVRSQHPLLELVPLPSALVQNSGGGRCDSPAPTPPLSRPAWARPPARLHTAE